MLDNSIKRVNVLPLLKKDKEDKEDQEEKEEDIKQVTVHVSDSISFEADIDEERKFLDLIITFKHNIYKCSCFCSLFKRKKG